MSAKKVERVSAKKAQGVSAKKVESVSAKKVQSGAPPASRQPGRTEEKLFLLLPWALLVAIVWVGISLLYQQGGLLHRSQLQTRTDELRQSRDQLQTEVERRLRELELIRSDDRAREEAVRSQLGLTQDGEVLYITPEIPDADETEPQTDGGHEADERQ